MSILTKVLKWFTDDDEEKKKKTLPKKEKTKSLPKKQEKKEVYGPPEAKKEDKKSLPQKNNFGIKTTEQILNPGKKAETKNNSLFMKQEDWKDPKKVEEYLSEHKLTKKNAPMSFLRLNADDVKNIRRAGEYTPLVGVSRDEYNEKRKTDKSLPLFGSYQYLVEREKEVGKELSNVMLSQNYKGRNGYIPDNDYAQRVAKDYNNILNRLKDFETGKFVNTQNMPLESVNITGGKQAAGELESKYRALENFYNSQSRSGTSPETANNIIQSRKAKENRKFAEGLKEGYETYEGLLQNQKIYKDLESKYNIDVNTFDEEKFKKWQKDNGVSKVTRGNALGSGPISYWVGDESKIKDANLLEAIVENEKRLKLSKEDKGRVAAFFENAANAVTLNALDLAERIDYEGTGLSSAEFVSPSQTLETTNKEHPVLSTAGSISGNLAIAIPASYGVNSLLGGSKLFAAAPKAIQAATQDFITFGTLDAVRTGFQGGDAGEVLNSWLRSGTSAAAGGALSSKTATWLDDLFQNPTATNNAWNTMLKRSKNYIVGASDTAGEAMGDAIYATITGQDQRTWEDFAIDGTTMFISNLFTSASAKKGAKNIDTGKEKLVTFIEGVGRYSENPNAETAKQLIKDGNALKKIASKSGFDETTVKVITDMVNFVNESAGAKTNVKNLPTTETVTPSLPTKKVTPVSTEGGKVETSTKNNIEQFTDDSAAVFDEAFKLETFLNEPINERGKNLAKKARQLSEKVSTLTKNFEQFTDDSAAVFDEAFGTKITNEPPRREDVVLEQQIVTEPDIINDATNKMKNFVEDFKKYRAEPTNAGEANLLRNAMELRKIASNIPDAETAEGLYRVIDYVTNYVEAPPRMDDAKFNKLLNNEIRTKGKHEAFATEVYNRFGNHKPQDDIVGDVVKLIAAPFYSKAGKGTAPFLGGIVKDEAEIARRLISEEDTLYRLKQEEKKINNSLKKEFVSDFAKGNAEKERTAKQRYKTIEEYINKIAKGEATETDFSKGMNLKKFKSLIDIRRDIYNVENNNIKGYNKQARRNFYEEVATPLAESSHLWIDKKTGLSYELHSLERNAYDIMGESAQEFINEFVAPYKANDAAMYRYNEEIAQTIADLGQTEAEYELTQRYREGLERNVSLEIQKAAEVYDRIFEKYKRDLNSTLVLNGYKPIGNPKLNLNAEDFRTAIQYLNGDIEYDNISKKEIRQFVTLAERNGIDAVNYDKKGMVTGSIDIPYNPHGQAKEFDLLKSSLGISDIVGELPGEIAGVTEDFKPNKKYSVHMQKRKGGETDYSYSVLDKYMYDMGQIIFHTSDITKFRMLEAALRTEYSQAKKDANIKEAFYSMDAEEFNKTLEAISNEELSSHNNFIMYLQNLTNLLAGKQHYADRGAEKSFGRKILNSSQAIARNWSTNQVGANISSWYNQLAQSTSILAENDMMDSIPALVEVCFGKVNFDDSDFITTRKGTLRLSKTAVDKILDVMFKLPQKLDIQMSKWAYQTKYNEIIRNGGTEAEAKKAGDVYASEIMGDRTTIGMPTIFGRKNFVSKLLTTFQVDAINQFDHYVKDLPRYAKTKGKGWLIKTIFATAIANYLYNELKEEATGTQGVLPDPIGLGIDIGKAIAGQDVDLKKSVIDQISRLPFGQTALVISGSEDVDRLPVASAVYDVTKGVADVAKGNFKAGAENFASAISLVNPFGGYNQARKTIQGIGAVAKGGVYDNNGNLQYPIEQNAGNYIKGALFGKYSLPESREYWDNNRRALTEDETKEYNYRVEQGENPQDVYNEIYGRKEVRKEKSLTNEEYKKAVEEMVTEFDYGTSLELDNLYNEYKGTNSKATAIGVPTASRNFSYNGEDYELTPEQCAELQNKYNEAYATGIDGILDDASLSTKEKYDKVSQIRKDVKDSVLTSFMKEQFDATGFNEDDEEEYRYRINKGENADTVYNEIVNRNEVKKQASKENKEYRNKADKLTTAFDEDAEYALDALYEAYKATNKDATKIDVPKAGKVLTVNGVDVELTPEQNAELQNRFNTEYYNGIAGVLSDDSLTEGQKYNKIKTIRSGVQKRVKTQFFNELRNGNVQQSAPVNDSENKTFEELFMGASSSGTTQQSAPQNAEQTKSFEELFMGAKPSNSSVTFHQGVKITNYNDGNHKGMDFALNTGTPIQSTVDGEVVTAKKIPNSYGTHVVIKDANGNYHYFAHLSSFNVKVGDKVTRGQNIGKSGNTGKSTGPHLHYEVRVGNNYSKQIDPRNYL